MVNYTLNSRGYRNRNNGYNRTVSHGGYEQFGGGRNYDYSRNYGRGEQYYGTGRGDIGRGGQSYGAGRGEFAPQNREAVSFDKGREKARFIQNSSKPQCQQC